MRTKLYQYLASAFIAHANCMQSDNIEWENNWKDAIDKTVDNVFPSGSGFDNGTTFDWDHSTPDRLVFITAFHHMDDMGGYDGWTHHTIIITPSLTSGFDIRVTGRNRNDIKNYIAEEFGYILNQDVTQGNAPVTYRDIHPTPTPTPTPPADNGQHAERWDGLA